MGDSDGTTLKRIIGVKKDSNSFQRKSIKRVADYLQIHPTEIVAADKWYRANHQLSVELISIVQQAKEFKGREFVFNEFEEFARNNSSGYFTLVGSPGIGKTAIAAMFVSKYKTIGFFANLKEGRNTPEDFDRSLREQLIERFQSKLNKKVEEEWLKYDLATLLLSASQKLDVGDRLAIVIDGLDEVKQESISNLLHLPENLPNRVYFLITRRPYDPELSQLYVSHRIPVKDLDLTDPIYDNYNRKDIEDYIHEYPEKYPEYSDGIRSYCEKHHINFDEFVRILGDKSENNFMYLQYALPSIADGLHKDLRLEELPRGLENYYSFHWKRMRVDDEKLKSIVLFLFLRLSTIPNLQNITCDIMVDIFQTSQQQKYRDLDEYEVEKLLKEWIQFFSPLELKQGNYRFYHTSFLNFLNKKREMDPQRIIFQEINNIIANYSEDF